MPKPSKRDQLIEATKALLWEVGYEAMSPRDIQARSAARPGSLYHHFPSKLAIAEAALAEAAEEEIARLDEIFAADTPPLEAVRHYLLVKREAFRGCRLGRLVHEASIEHEELRRPIAAYFDAVRNHIARSLAQAQSEGAFRADLDPETLAVSLTALIQGGYVLARTFNDEALMRRAADGALALLPELSPSK
ncbi:TetR/AcrR family transcriptional repressor of nem operon [Paraburkholderia sp. GAS199]|uniref:TetR/AcrR family transcriptional regulator n=1 Tax=Paraburkholderia sp. GAS199 TaxID=3035126 RepID=UPI003D1FFEF0